MVSFACLQTSVSLGKWLGHRQVYTPFMRAVTALSSEHLSVTLTSRHVCHVSSNNRKENEIPRITNILISREEAKNSVVKIWQPYLHVSHASARGRARSIVQCLSTIVTSRARGHVALKRKRVFHSNFTNTNLHYPLPSNPKQIVLTVDEPFIYLSSSHFIRSNLNHQMISERKRDKYKSLLTR